MLGALGRSITPESRRAGTIGPRAHGLSESGRCGDRRVPTGGAVWLVIATAIFNDLDTPGAWRHLMGTLRSLWSASAGGRARALYRNSPDA